MPPSPLRVTHVITGLGTGGAETMLHRLLAAWDPARLQSQVVCLGGEGDLASGIRGLGVPVTCLGLRSAAGAPAAVARIARALRRDRARVAQTWMYHADLLGGLAARTAGVPVVWGLRQSNLDPSLNKRSTLWTARACARLSRALPARIVANSAAGAAAHAALGYDATRMLVVANGLDVEQVRPDAAARRAVRRELGLTEETPLLGLVARWDPQKDHRTFVAAAGLVASRMPEARAVLCGRGVEHGNAMLRAWVEATGAPGAFHLLGHRSDVHRVQAALDVAVLSSVGEGFPNAVAEAMACGVPCVVTDAGDAAALVGETGRVVPPRDPAALAEAIEEMLALPAEKLRELGLLARRSIAQRFGIGTAAARLEALYMEVACAASRAS